MGGNCWGDVLGRFSGWRISRKMSGALFVRNNFPGVTLKVNRWIYIAVYVSPSLYLSSAQIWPMCNNGITQFHLPPTVHTRTIPAINPQPQGINAFWLVLTAPTHKGMARLSWPGWLVTYQDPARHQRLNPNAVTHPSTKRVNCADQDQRATIKKDHHHYCFFGDAVISSVKAGLIDWLIDWVRLNVPPNTL